MINKKIILWLVPFNKEIKPITDLEKEQTYTLSNQRAEEYVFSRGHTRDVLSKLFGINPLDVPLESYPGKPPLLSGGLGNISFSHCKDALFIGWSKKKIGVDIESRDRQFKFRDVSERYFHKEEKKELAKLSGERFRLSVLNLWVLKEAAIKWQKGSIIRDLSSWKINKTYTSAYNKQLDISLNTLKFKKKSWILGIAHEYLLINNEDILIDSN